MEAISLITNSNAEDPLEGSDYRNPIAPITIRTQGLRMVPVASLKFQVTPHAVLCQECAKAGRQVIMNPIGSTRVCPECCAVKKA